MEGKQFQREEEENKWNEKERKETKEIKYYEEIKVQNSDKRKKGTSWTKESMMDKNISVRGKGAIEKQKNKTKSTS